MVLILAPFDTALSQSKPNANDHKPATQTCELETGPTRAVARVRDGETLVLDDGTIVRLIGTHAPHNVDAAADAEFWAPEQQARNALERLVAGQSVEIAFAGERTNRYGHTLAHVYLTTAAGRVWVQGYMVENGHARAYGLAGSSACLSELMALEERARQANLGLWSHAAYQVRRAERTRELLRYRNTFQLVEGRVRTVARVRSQILINFGEDWRLDFTAGLRSDRSRGLGHDKDALKALEGRAIRVRGWIEWRGGPYVQLLDAQEIEVLAEE